jgi:hypothetical protein
MLAGSFLDVLARFVRLASILAALFILAGLIGFLTDTVRNTSISQATRIPDPGSGRIVTTTADLAEPNPPAAIEKLREANHTKAREVIDDVGDVMMAPFGFLIDGSEAWVKRLLYSALALLVYGLLGQVLANALVKSSDGARRAEVAERERKAAEERKRTGSFASPA